LVVVDATLRPLPLADRQVGPDAGLTTLVTTSEGETVANPKLVVDKWFPSSKLCSACGALVDRPPLSVRWWICPSCTAEHHRDVSAARNLLAAGLAERQNACGANVRPHRGNLLTGGRR
jgi:transposase